MCLYSVAQLCPTFCDPMDCNLPGSSVHGFFHYRILEQVAISYSRESSQTGDRTHVSCFSCTGRQIPYCVPPGKPSHYMHECVLSHFSRVQLCVTLWTTACKPPLSMEFSRQEYWSGLLCPSQGDLPDPGIEPAISYIFLHWQVSVFFFFFFTASTTWEAPLTI